jgi:hypothetical protein
VTFNRPCTARSAQREHPLVPRQRTEQTVTDGQNHDVRPGVRVTHHKTHRDRLSGEQLAQLAEPGINWTQDAG